SRMKDFFDCYQLLTQRNLNDDTLFEAVKATFDNRHLEYKSNLNLFSDEFVTDKDRISRWKVFLKKIKWEKELPFSSVMQIIKERLQPMADRYWRNQRYN
ncbi:MAG: nucleotidyl transferase AbiEii/AbiGii toxin family protein, partial [Bacteroidaceae bacterium]